MLRYLFFAWILLSTSLSVAQHHADSVTHTKRSLERLCTTVISKSRRYENTLDKHTSKVLVRFQRQEDRIRRKLIRLGNVAALDVLKKDSIPNFIYPLGMTYNEHFDTLQTTLRFLSSVKQLTQEGGLLKSKLSAASGHIAQLQDKLGYAERVRNYLQSRQQAWKQQLSSYTRFSRSLKKLNKDTWYYSQQLRDYKALLKDRTKAQEQAIILLRKIPAYNDFLRRNSQLSGLFNLPASGTVSDASGQQTRAQVEALIAARQSMNSGPGASSASPGSYMENQLDGARSQLNELRDKVGNGNNDLEMPDFKPNSQHNKSFLQRLEYGINLQPQQAASLIPAVSTLGLSLGYHINDKSVAGIGVAYRLGLGKPIKQITLTNEGVSLRSYLDLKLKKSFWISGGFEYNYMNRFRQLSTLYNPDKWQQSGLIGLTNKSKVGKKEVKIQLLWDFLSYRQIPSGQPLKFRFGYNLK